MICAGSVADGAAGAGVGGYTLISADSLDEAVSLVKGHPFLSRGGRLVVSEAVAP